MSDKNYCLYCKKEIPFFNKANKPRKYCTEHHRKGTHGRPFQKGLIPHNKKKFYSFDPDKKNYCKYCNAEIPWLNRHGDPQSYCKGHEHHAPREHHGPEREKAWNWKGGRKMHQGYVLILKPEHPRAQKSGYVYEHILVAEQKLGRSIDKKEIIHHKDRNRSNNNPDNLDIITQSQHSKEHRWLERPGILEGSRTCCECGSNITSMKKYKDYEVPIWFEIDKERGLWKCRRCYRREYEKVQYLKNVAGKPKIEGKKITRGGYLRIKVPNHSRADKRGWVLEHVVVAEQKIGRPLKSNEQVHHINGIKDDNRPENLDVVDGQEHNRMHGFNRGRKKR